ncbi:MAG: hypothetical protein ACP5NF_04925 [Thermoanaerobaculum sp.]
MAAVISPDVFEALERHLGREDALTVVRGLEASLNRAVDYRWATTKEELLAVMRREFVTREVFEERLASFRAELLAKSEKDKAELLGRLEKDKAEVLGRLEKDKAEVLGRLEKDKAEVLGIIEALREKTERDKAELVGMIEALREKTERDKAEVLGKIENLKLSMDKNITVWFSILLFAIVFLNRDALEFLARLFGLLR